MLKRWLLATGLVLASCGGRTNAELPGGSGTAGVGAIGGGGGGAGSGGNPAGSAGTFPGGTSGSSGGFPVGGAAGTAGSFPGGSAGFPIGGSAGAGGGGVGCLVGNVVHPPGSWVSDCCYCGPRGFVTCLPGCGGTGGASSGGSSGVDGGSPVCPAPPPDLSPLIDDFEDGDTKPYHPGSLGAWYGHGNGTGVMDWGITSSPSSRYALFAVGAGHDPGSQSLGVTLYGLDRACPRSAAGYKGLRFSTALALNGSGSLRANLVTLATQSFEEGGTCRIDCGDHFGAALDVGTSWTTYELPFEIFVQQGWGDPAALNPSQIRGVEFVVLQGSVWYELVLDDVSFY